jgi:hypothetical protein
MTIQVVCHGIRCGGGVRGSGLSPVPLTRPATWTRRWAMRCWRCGVRSDPAQSFTGAIIRSSPELRRGRRRARPADRQADARPAAGTGIEGVRPTPPPPIRARNWSGSACRRSAPGRPPTTRPKRSTTRHFLPTGKPQPASRQQMSTRPGGITSTRCTR